MNETWIKLRHALPLNDSTPVRIAYERADGTINDDDSHDASHTTTGAILNKLAALYGTEAPSDIGGSKTCWQYFVKESRT